MRAVRVGRRQEPPRDRRHRRRALATGHPRPDGDRRVTLRRWESWVVADYGGVRDETRLARHFFWFTAWLRIALEPSAVTADIVQEWNRTWPDEKITNQRWEVRRS